jgi:hypothetical protein
VQNMTGKADFWSFLNKREENKCLKCMNSDNLTWNSCFSS